ncbi:unnamed protein product [Euphydryas editha]|uniref:SRCR domain-containing protein n=1 Tax=Euphydryas editha TaxID=104508 RepID=A0AAU9ULW4_EUPED|nr:unnamed protein product [Euphydryas editha]
MSMYEQGAVSWAVGGAVCEALAGDVDVRAGRGVVGWWAARCARRWPVECRVGTVTVVCVSQAMSMYEQGAVSWAVGGAVCEALAGRV